MKLFFTGFLIILYINVFAQHETDERIVGFKYVLKFINNEPKINIHNIDFYNPHNLNYKGPNVIPYVNSICDTLGNILFYYDGATLYSSDGSVMSDGNLHAYNFSSHYTSNLIVPIEESNRRYYYLFEVLPNENNWDYQNNKPINCPPSEICPEFRDVCTLTYNIIDIHGNGGKGKVIKNNIFVADSVAPSISGTKHKNNIDTWVTVLKSGSDKLLNFRVNSCNIQAAVSSIIPDYEYPKNPYVSYIAANGLGYQLVYATNGDFGVFPGTVKSKNTSTSNAYTLFVVPFDNETGMFETDLLKKISVRSGFNINLFSHDSRYLYYHDTDWFVPVWCFQYDLITETSTPFYFNLEKNRCTGMDYGNTNEILIYKYKLTPLDNNLNYKFEGYLGKIKNINQPFSESDLVDSLKLPSYEQPAPTPFFSYIARNNYIYNFYHPDYKKPNAFPVAHSISNTVASPACFNVPVSLKGNTTIPVDSMHWIVKKGGQPGWQRFNADTFSLPVSPGIYTASLVAYKYCLPDTATHQFTIEDHPRVHLAEDSVYTCESKSVDLPANTTYTYHWENVHGDVVPNQISETGQYNMVVQNSCGSDEDSLYVSSSILNIANLVTANNDANNDCWKIKSNNSAEKIQVSIYNSWGSAVFSDNNYQNNWCPHDENDGIYYYDITYNNACIKKGWVEVMH